MWRRTSLFLSRASLFLSTPSLPLAFSLSLNPFLSLSLSLSLTLPSLSLNLSLSPLSFVRKGSCKRGDACEFAHGVFECWLHPARYRTQPSKDGTACPRRVCFFAHTPCQLRVLPPQHANPRGGAGPGSAAAAAAAFVESYDGSPLRHRAVEAAYMAKGLMSSSPMWTLMSPPVSPPSESPPMSPGAAAAVRRASWPAVGDLVASLRQMQLSKVESPPRAWGFCCCGGGGLTAVGLRREGALRVGEEALFDVTVTTPWAASTAVTTVTMLSTLGACSVFFSGSGDHLLKRREYV